MGTFAIYIGVTWGPWLTQREPTVSSGINPPQRDTASTPRYPTASREISVRRQHSSREPTVSSGMISPLAGSREYQPGPTASREILRYPEEKRRLGGILNVFHGISIPTEFPLQPQILDTYTQESLMMGLFERSEFLIGTPYKKNLRVCPRARVK